MYIKKNNLLIRNAETSDAPTLSNWWNDGKVMEHAGFPNGLCITVDKVREQLKEDSDDTHRRLIIEYNNTPIGEMNYNNMGNKTAQIGIKICEFSSQDKGLGTKLLNMLIHELFNIYGYERIILDTNLKNKRAQYVYEKIGFKKVKTNINSWKDQLGRLQSSIDYELKKFDWGKYNE